MSGVSPAAAPIAARSRRVALPIVGAGAAIRSSRSSRWRAAVLIAVHLAFVAHLAHWFVAGETLSPLEPSEGMELAKVGVVNAGLIFFVLAAAATAVFGRFFCGWGCHLVALQDLCQWLLRRVGIRPQPLRSRALAWVPLAAFVYMFLWPAIYRLAAGVPYQSLEVRLMTRDFWATFPGWGVGLATFAVCGFAIVYLLGAKGFCTYACPYGALFGLADRVAPGRIRVSEACNGCGHCTAVCTSNVRVHQEVRDFRMVVDPGCMKCLDCVSVCPNDALSFGFGRPALSAKSAKVVPAAAPKLSSGEELTLALAFVAALFALRGLYGLFPFLYTLGLAACFAYLTLVVGRLASARDLAVRRVQLRRAGRLSRAGVVLLGLYTVLAALVLHSAVVRTTLALGEAGERRSAGWRQRVLAGADLPDFEPVERRRAAGALDWLERAERWGLLNQPGLASRMAWLALVAERPASLARHAQAALAEPGEARAAWLLVGLRHELAGRLDLAQSSFARAIDAAPHSAAAYLRLGLMQARNGDLRAARSTFEEGIRAAGAGVELEYNLALVFGLSGDFDEAISGLRRALAIDPEHLPSRENLEALLAESEGVRGPAGRKREGEQPPE